MDLMTDDSEGTLTMEECEALLGPGGIGRVAVSIRALPVILPVRYRWTLDGLVLIPPADDRLHAALIDRVVGFGADALTAAGEGWCINVVGRAVLSAPAFEVRLPLEVMSGRRFSNI